MPRLAVQSASGIQWWVSLDGVEAVVLGGAGHGLDALGVGELGAEVPAVGEEPQVEPDGAGGVEHGLPSCSAMVAARRTAERLHCLDFRQ